MEELGAIDAETVALTKRLPDASRKLNAVSYTHLDVYKRQVRGRVGRERKVMKFHKRLT